MTETIGAKIKKKLEKEGYSQAFLGSLLGRYSGQLIGQYISGCQKPKVEFLEKWLEVFGEDLRETNVSPLKVTRTRVREYVDEQRVKDDSVHYEPKKKPGKIPFYDVIAVGGASVMMHEQDAVSDRPTEMIDPGTFLRAATGALRVYGHSMYPKYPAGCIVAFKASSKPIPDVIVWGEDYVIELEDRRIIKKVDKGDTKDYIKAVSMNGTNEEKMKYQFDTIDIPLSAVKRMYMVLGKIVLEASI